MTSKVDGVQWWTGPQETGQIPSGHPARTTVETLTVLFEDRHLKIFIH